MKKLFGLAALAVFASSAAYATTLLVQCGQFQAAGPFTTASAATTGTFNCAAVTQATIGAGNTFQSLKVILETDYSGGLLGSLNTIQTNYSSTPNGVFVTDTLTATSAPGTGNSQSYSSADGAPNYAPGGPQYFSENTNIAALPSTAFTVNYSSVVTAGGVQTLSGQVYELITFAPAVGGVPEPTTVSLMGAGLLGLGFIRKFKKKA